MLRLLLLFALLLSTATLSAQPILYQLLDSIVVRPSPFRKSEQSPVSIRRMSAVQIEKSAGANRDVSKIVQSYPGVAFSPAGYRNDLIVRGGSPSENRFYVDGIEIPNINHFSTQGASGGPVSILNADLIREIEFYSGAFPLQSAGALSSIMEVSLKDGDPDKQSFKATVGASELSLSGSGHLSPRTTYLFSVRQSYLQLLFKLLGLPFLPNFIDAQIKVRHKISLNDEISLLALTGIDRMRLNEEGTTSTSEYILSYLPKIEQQTITTGVRYRHFTGEESYSLVASHSYLNNLNLKYRDNDESSEDNLNLRLRSREQKSTLRSDNRNTLADALSLRYGAQLEYLTYSIDSYQRLATDENRYATYLDYLAWGVHIGVGYLTPNDRLSTSAGIRLDGNTFSSQTARVWQHLSPRLALSYSLPRDFAVSGSVGIYHTMPPLSALSYEVDGVRVNSALDYIGVTHYILGIEWQPRKEFLASIEGFYKRYRQLPISIENDTPLADLGLDYGTIGNEALVQSGRGRAYGVELLGEWQVAGRVALVASFTIYRSEYAISSDAEYRPSTWDNRFIFNTSGTYFLPKGWSVGGKISAIGGAPYTPYDQDASSLILNWDVTGAPIYDYSLYNTERLNGYLQFDLRVDKSYYYPKWMLGLYLDLQNVFVSKYREQDIPMSTGEIDPDDPTRYKMRYLENVSGVLLPTIGITATF